LYSSPNTIRVIKSRRMRWAGDATWMKEMRKVHKFSVGKCEAKDLLGDLYVDGYITLKWTLMHYWVSTLERCNQPMCAHSHTMSPRFVIMCSDHALLSYHQQMLTLCNPVIFVWWNNAYYLWIQTTEDIKLRYFLYPCSNKWLAAP
jgi:hypothetical protein